MLIHKKSSNSKYTECGELIEIDMYRYLHSTEDSSKVTCKECSIKEVK